MRRRALILLGIVTWGLAAYLLGIVVGGHADEPSWTVALGATGLVVGFVELYWAAEDPAIRIGALDRLDHDPRRPD